MAASAQSVLALLSTQRNPDGLPGLRCLTLLDATGLSSLDWRLCHTCRLNLLPALISQLTMSAQPFHLCGSEANTALALHLAKALGPEEARKLCAPLVIASISSSGVRGDTPWTHPLVSRDPGIIYH